MTENGKTFGAPKDQDVEDPIKYGNDEKPSKILRALTVSVYLFSVSFVAILLSLYYIFLWNPDRENTARLTDDAGEYYVSEAYHTNERL